MIELATAVYTAFRGYSWSQIPNGLTERLLDRLRELATAGRGDFADADTVERGIVAIGPVAAVFTIRNVAEWDSAGRDCSYSAFVCFSCRQAAAFDFGRLLELPFLAQPVREPPAAITYTDGPSAPAPLAAAGPLVCHRHLDALPAAQCGDLLARSFARSGQWSFRPNPDGTMRIDCAQWQSIKDPHP